MSNKRTETIATLTEHLDHWKRLLSEGVCTKEEGEKTINALNFAIESIKVDRAYDLAYEKVDFIEIPKGATKGDMIMAMFSDFRVTDLGNGMIKVDISESYDEYFEKTWWNSPFILKKETSDLNAEE